MTTLFSERAAGNVVEARKDGELGESRTATECALKE